MAWPLILSLAGSALSESSADMSEQRQKEIDAENEALEQERLEREKELAADEARRAAMIRALEVQQLPVTGAEKVAGYTPRKANTNLYNTLGGVGDYATQLGQYFITKDPMKNTGAQKYYPNGGMDVT